ncbi:MAG: ComEC family competence protein [Bacteroidales bacterium]|nr:ComEC family competence protein [Bacteroidales bacterium]
MINWHPYPFFRVIVPFAAGILLAIAIGLPPGTTPGIWILVTFAAMLPVVFTIYTPSYRHRYLPGLFYYLFFLVAGFTLVLVRTPALEPLNISNYKGSADQYILRIAEPVRATARSYRTTAALMYAVDSGVLQPVSGKVLVYFAADSAAAGLNYGDVLIVSGLLTKVPPPGNPHQFDYRRFLANSGIYHQMFLKSSGWRKTERTSANPLFTLAYAARHRLLDILRSKGFGGDEYAVISAILLGYDAEMDRELRQRYAGAGALHILCVSGLHVGIIFFIFNFLFSPLDRSKRTRWLKVLLLLLAIWSYAFITGLSPSVLRAAVMFSLFSWRESRRARSNPYNILAASAFILLVYNPYIIMLIGFQLSYAAVLAIVALFDPIYRLLAFRNFLADQVWKLMVVSLTAQIGTFPLAIYYFHQFPVYFFITNLVVIPLAWLIINTGVLLLLVSWISVSLSAIFGMLLSVMLMVMNGAVEFIQSLPGAVLHGLVLHLPQVVLIYLLIIVTTRFAIDKNFRMLMSGLGLVAVLLASFVVGNAAKLHQQKVIIYQINGHSALEVVQGRRAILIADSALLADDQAMEFSLAMNHTYSGIRHLDIFTHDTLPRADLGEAIHFYKPNFLSVGVLRFAFIDPSYIPLHSSVPLRVDYVVVQQNPKIDLPDLATQYDFEAIIFDASNSWYRLRDWTAWCDSTETPYHNIREDGYFERPLASQSKLAEVLSLW